MNCGGRSERTVEIKRIGRDVGRGRDKRIYGSVSWPEGAERPTLDPPARAR